MQNNWKESKKEHNNLDKRKNVNVIFLKDLKKFMKNSLSNLNNSKKLRSKHLLKNHNNCKC